MPDPLIEEYVEKFRRRKKSIENLKTGCAKCGSDEDHGVNSNFTHQYDVGLEHTVFDDESFLRTSLKEYGDKRVEALQTRAVIENE